MTQLTISDQIDEVNQQFVILKHVITEKTLEEIIRDISK
jgi:hypothetical protein